ncbi:MAG: RNA 2',3'-cyclic phosphodiesterase [Dehalococcoidia bacterium]|nr:MAG: RNA 2',3'-cyclic phosphodiesterase [Dehalococcoidia bacterium]
MEQIRSFISIELPAELKLELVQLEAQLKSGGQSGVKWVDPDGIHLTLKFLGSIAVDRVEGITRAMEEAVHGISPFQLKVKELGVFPNFKRVQVAWVGLSGEVDKLAQLQKRIESNLIPLGFAPESRPFAPHLTLARLRAQTSPDEKQRFGQLIANTTFESAHTIEVDAISLMKSQLTREGAIYSQINSIRLEKPLSTVNP